MAHRRPLLFCPRHGVSSGLRPRMTVKPGYGFVFVPQASGFRGKASEVINCVRLRVVPVAALQVFAYEGRIWKSYQFPLNSRLWTVWCLIFNHVIPHKKCRRSQTSHVIERLGCFSDQCGCLIPEGCSGGCCLKLDTALFASEATDTNFVSL